MFTAMIWGGAAITLIGLVLLGICIAKVKKAQTSGASEEEMRAVLQSAGPLNLGGLFLSAIGLMMVVVGILFA